MKVRIRKRGSAIAEFWYDPHVRSWCARLIDEEGNQIDDCHYTYTRREIEYIVDHILEAAS